MPLPENKVLMRDAMIAVQAFLPDKPHVWSAVQHYVDFYTRKIRDSAAPLSIQSVLTNFAPLQTPIHS